VEVKTCIASCQRSGSWWSISVPEIKGLHSHARRLDQVEGMARDAIAPMLDVPAESFAVEVRPEFPPAAARAVEARRAAKDAAKEAEGEPRRPCESCSATASPSVTLARCWDGHQSGSHSSLIRLPRSRFRQGAERGRGSGGGMPRDGGPTDQVRAKVALRIHCPDVLGAIAQLVEHLLGRQGVRGSSPLSSTQRTPRSEESLW
jgi:predicted RNase H-like HicB family nuclease